MYSERQNDCEDLKKEQWSEEMKLEWCKERNKNCEVLENKKRGKKEWKIRFCTDFLSHILFVFPYPYMLHFLSRIIKPL